MPRAQLRVRKTPGDAGVPRICLVRPGSAYSRPIARHPLLVLCWSPRTRGQPCMQSSVYDAIVVGSGISGGWAAKELTEKGLRVLLLERGRNVEHIKDYVNATKAPWQYAH